MRCGALFLSMWLVSAALAQSSLSVYGQALTLGSARAVAVDAKGMTWEPGARALVYDATDVEGEYQGAYRTDTGKGKAVLRLPEGTVIQDGGWLPKRNWVAFEMAGALFVREIVARS